MRTVSMRVVAVGSRPFVAGFRLAGASGVEVDSPEALLRETERLVRARDVGLILLDENLSTGVRQEISRIRAEHPTPIIYEVPGPGGSLKPVNYRDILRQILGV